MTTAASNNRASLLAAWRSAPVAAAVGITDTTWSSTTTPRVWVGAAGYMGGRNRGRCPFVEIALGPVAYGYDARGGGSMTTQARIIVHGTGRDQQTAAERLEAIMAAGFAAMRDADVTNYQEQGNERLAEVTPGPMGWMLEATVTIEQSYGTDDFGTE